MYVSEPPKLFIIYPSKQLTPVVAQQSQAQHDTSQQHSSTYIGSAGQLDSLTTRDQDLRSVYIYTKAKRSEGIT